MILTKYVEKDDNMKQIPKLIGKNNKPQLKCKNLKYDCEEIRILVRENKGGAKKV